MVSISDSRGAGDIENDIKAASAATEDLIARLTLAAYDGDRPANLLWP